MHSSDEVLRAAATWAWFPRDSEQIRDGLLLVRDPARFGGGVRASQVDAMHEPAALVAWALERTAAWGEREITFWTSSSDRPDLEGELKARGAELIDAVAVFALPIAGADIDVPASATAEIVRTLDQVREVDAINVPVWQQDPLDDAGLQTELAEVAAALTSGEGVRVIGRLDGRAVSTGGCTIVDGFSRLWGAATLEEARGHGAYRAVLAERLRASAELGASTALVKGRHSTSAPILARAGFRHYGDERAYRLTL